MTVTKAYSDRGLSIRRLAKTAHVPTEESRQHVILEIEMSVRPNCDEAVSSRRGM